MACLAARYARGGLRMKTATEIPQAALGELAETYTFGKLFPDGSLVEPVASRDGNGLDLLFKSGKKVRIARKIELEGRL